VNDLPRDLLPRRDATQVKAAMPAGNDTNVAGSTNQKRKKTEGSKRFTDSVDPFHMPTELADGLGVESLPRMIDANAPSPDMPRSSKTPLFRKTIQTRWFVLGSPRLPGERRLRRSSNTQIISCMPPMSTKTFRLARYFSNIPYRVKTFQTPEIPEFFAISSAPKHP
jgi:hypothetical protein